MSAAELARQRMTSPAKPKAEGDEVLENFLRGLMDVCVLSIAQNTESESAPIIGYLTDVAKEPEVILTRCALAYTEAWRLAEAEALLGQVLAQKPDYEPAQVLFAGVLGLQNKSGYLPIAEGMLAKSTNPSLRGAARTIIELEDLRQRVAS